MQRPRLAGACFSRHRGFHAPRSILRETRRMSRAPRFVGYALMGAAVLLALAMRRGALSAIGPFSAVAAADRKSVVQGKSVSVRVDLGGRRILKKKTHIRQLPKQLT